MSWLFRRVWLLSFRRLLFFNERQKGVNLEGMGAGEKQEGTEGEETVNRIYCMRKDFFNKKNGKSFLKN